MWTVRRATRRDTGALVALCRESVGPEDYVPAVLEDFLRTGVVFVAEEPGQAVGMMVYHDVPDGSAWLHAARTHPDRRQQGVATALMGACERVARARRRNAMRLWAEASNAASVAANRGYGYRECARFTRMRVGATPSRTAAAVERLRLDAQTWAALRDSPFMRLSEGFLFHDFYFLQLDRVNAARLAREGALWRTRRGAISLSEGPAEEGQVLQIQPLFGDFRAILRLAPSVAASRGADRAETFLPRRAEVLAAARAAGFRRMEWGREAILFEKQPGPQGRRRSPRPGGRPS